MEKLLEPQGGALVTSHLPTKSRRKPDSLACVGECGPVRIIMRAGKLEPEYQSVPRLQPVVVRAASWDLRVWDGAWK